MTTDLLIPDWLEPVELLMPPADILEPALLSGYDPLDADDHPLRFIAFFWEPGGDEARYYDGRIGADAYWPAYLAWVQFGPNANALSPYDLGSSDSPARHYLVLDRETRACYCGKAAHVRHWLMDQHPLPLPLDDVPQEQLEEMLKVLNRELSRQLSQLKGPTMSEILEQMEQDHARTERLTAWLDSSLRNEN